jgi:hypothetical protein
MTPNEEREYGLMRELRARWKAFDACPANDVNLLADTQRHIRRIESELATLGVTSAEVVAFNLRADKQERRQRKLGADAAYERTGVVPHETQR